MPCMRHAAVSCIFLTDMTSLTFSFIFNFIFELLNIFMEFSKSNWSMLLTFPLLEFSFTIWIIPDPSHCQLFKIKEFRCNMDKWHCMKCWAISGNSKLFINKTFYLNKNQFFFWPEPFHQVKMWGLYMVLWQY